MTHRACILAFIPLVAAACDTEVRGAADGGFIHATRTSDMQACAVVSAEMALPAEVRESSGLARSARDPNLFWTHNDAGHGPELFAVNETGKLMQRVRVTGAESVDWEDIEAAPCGHENCLYIGDIGDNDARRDRVTVYRVVEPAAGASETAPAEAWHARYPDGPRDAEALFVDASGAVYIVTKGRRGAISLYRWPMASAPGQTVVLERVRDLFPEPEHNDDRVTAATATPNGRWVGIRTYRTLYLYPAAQLLGAGDPAPVTVDLTHLAQAQGESLVLADDGSAWLSSEAEKSGQPRWIRLKCTLGTEGS
jgi:hypothetical protein